MRGGMKGVEASSLLILVLAVVALIVGLNLALSLSKNQFQAVTAHNDMFTLANADEASYGFARSALDLSVYGACAVSLRRGGLSDISSKPSSGGAAYWYRGGVLYPSDAGFLSGLGDQIRVALNGEVTGGMQFQVTYKADMQPFQSVQVSPGASPAQLSVSATAGDARSSATAEGQQVTIGHQSSISGAYGIDCYSLFLAGKVMLPDVFGDVRSRIASASSSWAASPQSGADEAGLRQSILGIQVPAQERDGYTVTAEVEDATVSVQDGQPLVLATARVTVTPKDGREYPVYDPDQKKLVMAPMSLSFLLEVPNSDVEVPPYVSEYSNRPPMLEDMALSGEGSPELTGLYGGLVTVSGRAFDPDANLAEVSLSVSDVSQGSFDCSGAGSTECSWSVVWDTRTMPDGGYTLGVTATDSLGKQATSTLPIRIRNS
jgi:hypothetical protein